MKTRWVSSLAVALAVLAGAETVRADWLADFFHSIPRDTKRRNCWPEPFDGPDRYAVRSPFVTMVDNGWRLQNLLGDYHFDTNTGLLNEAGQLKVQWIVRHAPQGHRVIFVSQSMDSQQAAARVDNVQQYVAQIAGDNSTMPSVVQTPLLPPGSPADQVETVGRKFYSSIPEPRLPQAESALTGGGG